MVRPRTAVTFGLYALRVRRRPSGVGDEFGRRSCGSVALVNGGTSTA